MNVNRLKMGLCAYPLPRSLTNLFTITGVRRRRIGVRKGFFGRTQGGRLQSSIT